LEAGNDGVAESEDEDPEATKWYWEAKWKKEGIRKVCDLRLSCRYVLSCVHVSFSKPKKKSNATCDIRLIFKKDIHDVKGEPTAGEYCQLCL
jgi:hypothetical protein